eukprot:TRINITY_DN1226_c0_g1_i17.p2 TRINITY_DN1226_c0_g1~~TRINITY_DN1226_c0_g1_i17.p2  ORF type:complete len:313 (-),score=32.66 TRINITY_DN1226_c0_g1_i17:419-1357(-)
MLYYHKRLFLCLVILVSLNQRVVRCNDDEDDDEDDKKTKELDCKKKNALQCDINFLQLFYSQMSEGAQQILSSWSEDDEDIDPCEGWVAVECEVVRERNKGDLRRVTSLVLDAVNEDINIDTSIPEEISNLRFLKRLGMYNVGATGTLPVTLSLLKDLEIVDIGSFGTGTLPPEYSTLKKMTSFHVDYGYLRGSLPVEYSKWKKMKSFGLYYQQLRGTLPKQYSTWKELIELWLGVNFLSGTLPVEYTKMKFLRNIDITENSLSGEVPSEYSTLDGSLWFYPQEGGLCIWEHHISLFRKETLNSDFELLERC